MLRKTGKTFLKYAEREIFYILCIFYLVEEAPISVFMNVKLPSKLKCMGNIK